MLIAEKVIPAPPAIAPDRPNIGEKPGADVKYLQTEGDKLFSTIRNKYDGNGKYVDGSFDKAKALGQDSSKFDWSRAVDMSYRNKKNYVGTSKEE